MKNKELRITVAGKSCTGKTTIMKLIHDMLIKHGCEVELEFIHNGDAMEFKEIESDKYSEYFMNNRINAVAESVKIILSEKQVKHSVIQSNNE